MRPGKTYGRVGAWADTVGAVPSKACWEERFSSAFVRISAVRDVAIEVFRYGDFRGERTPSFRDLNVFLFEDDLAAIVGYFRGAAFPFDLIEGRGGRIAEDPLKTKAAAFFLLGSAFTACGGVCRFI